MFNKKSQQENILQKGFTMIEMLLVVSTIGILTVVTIKTIDVNRQQRVAQDATRSNNLKEVVDSIETFRLAEGKYPAEGTANNPLDSSAADRTVLLNYLSLWPQGVIYNVAGNTFEVHIEMATAPSRFFKYYSVWREIRECANVSGIVSCNI